MRATVCQLAVPSTEGALEEDWRRLKLHVREADSDLVLLPEMPFYPWLPAAPDPEPEPWRAAVAAHDRWVGRLGELGAELVAGSRPVLEDGRRYNEGFLWSAGAGYRAVQRKRHLPDEPGFWEATWYEPGPEGPFRAFELDDGLRIGYLICTDIWFGRHARELSRAGAHLILCPRATPAETREKWMVGGRAAAITSGAWCLSSNFSGSRAAREASSADAESDTNVPSDGEILEFAGGGWVVEPEAGDVMAVTDQDRPFLTRELDRAAAEAAKETYPRYVR